MVRAKFNCENKTAAADGKGGSVSLRAVSSGSPENERFFFLTPAAQISLATINESAYAQFEIGKQYYVDFSPAN